MNRFQPSSLARFFMFRSTAEVGAGGGPADPAAAPPGGDAGAAKWFDAYGEEDRTFLTAKGLTVDDPLEALPKVLGIARNAEKRIGKGLDTIIDRPKEGQAWSEWARGNATALGLPENEDGYTIDKPADWPKDAPWNDDLAAKARKIAFDHGLPPSALQANVELFAEHVKDLNASVDREMQEASAKMMGELEKDWGGAMPQKLALAKQGAQALAQAAGLGDDALALFSASLAPKTGDAVVMRMFAAVGELLGEDSAPGLGKGGALSMTPSDAQAELTKNFLAPDSAFAKAVKEGNRDEFNRLRPEYDRLSRIAAGGK